MATSLRDLRRARRLVVSDPETMGGDLVFCGTRIPVHMIAGLVAQGSASAELLVSYPRLTPPHGRDDPPRAGLRRRLSAARAAAPAALARSSADATRPPAVGHHRGVVRLLIHECLSVDLVTVAGQCGHEARYVAHIGRAGWKNWNVAATQATTT